NGCTRTRTLTYTATDCGTNTSTCSQVITWAEDMAAPVFTKCPTNMDLGCNPATIPACDTTTNNVIATDNCGVTNISCASVDTIAGCLHTRTNTYTARDGCNNSATCVQIVSWTATSGPSFTGCPSA